MSIKKITMLIGLCVLFSACSTEMYSTKLPSDGNYIATNKGVRYLLGRGVPQNNEKAFAYFREGASEGDPLAQNELAFLYAAGKGTTQDYRQAFIWYQKAAQQGLASAQYNLGLLYLYGLGTTRNQALAIHWFQKASGHGFMPATEIIGTLRM